ncbi:Asp-tRNA(Asn)/Glu-tRNA(Gln) amidotransferase subunit GatC [Patescibacteria group bacterium]|nr:Asp-tRNA(Asn)/Glu-tRNA(Gln) amidotransferase subunit GatC [Patescibacteria group bacterium]
MKIDVVKVAKLANLPLSSEEEEKYSDQLSRILDYIDKLNEVDTKSVESTFNVTDLSNTTREDATVASLSQEEALSNAPKKKENFFETKGIFDNE